MIRSFPPLLIPKPRFWLLELYRALNRWKHSNIMRIPAMHFGRLLPHYIIKGAEFCRLSGRKPVCWPTGWVCGTACSFACGKEALTAPLPTNSRTISTPCWQKHPAVRRLPTGSRPSNFSKNIMPLSCCGQSIIFCLQPVRPMPLIRWMTKSNLGSLSEIRLNN